MTGPYGGILILFASRTLSPMMQLYGVYVLVHGHYSPGGGFQAGAALAGSYLMPRIVEGSHAGQHGLTTRRATHVAIAGMLLYALVGIASIMGGTGATFLDYSGLAGLVGATPAGGATRAIGSLLIELGITMTVMGILVILYDDLVAKSQEEVRHDEH
jgi:multicomponent Na+:H+ antiporter subunit B